MRFLFRSDLGSSIPIIRRLESEGHDAVMCLLEDSKDAKYRVGDGLVDKTKDFPAAVKWADVIVYDGNRKGMPEEADNVSRSKPVIGSSVFGNDLEHDRLRGIKIIENAGLKSPEYRRFSGPSAFVKAAMFVESQKEDSGWVFKPNVDKFRTFVTYSIEEMLRMFDWAEHKCEALKVRPDFILQKRHDGVEVSTEAWFTGSEWCVPNSTLETNRLMNGDLGEIIGCAGNVVWLHRSMDAPLPKQLLQPLTKVLEGKYRGPVDINAIIDEETHEPLFLEFTPRFGYSAIFALMELVPDFGDLLASVAKGEPYEGPLLYDRYAIGIRATIPPFPNSDDGEDSACGIPILGFDAEHYTQGINPVEVRMDDHNCPQTSGPEGLVFEFTASAPTVEEARRLMYEKAHKVHVRNIRYRTDIGIDAEKDFGKLVALGYAKKPDRTITLFGRGR